MSENDERISRRNLLKILGITTLAVATAGDSIVAHQFGFRTLTKEFWEGLETSSLGQNPSPLRTYIEQKYNIRLLDKSNASYDAYAGYPEGYLPLTRSNWDTPSLKLVEETLNILPPSFYHPIIFNKNDMSYYSNEDIKRTLPLILSIYDDIGTNLAGYSRMEGEIKIGKQELGLTLLERDKSKRTLIHELAHHATYNNPLFLASAPDIQLSIGLLSQKDLWNSFKDIITLEQDPKSQETKMTSWNKHIGYGAKTFDEFWAVAAEFYTAGRVQFTREYQEFLGLQRTEVLYQNLREHLFEDYEYSNYQRIR